jgi:pseudaminic acid cytidylyltransferase
MNIAIIPARGGSKRIPRKNIKNFYGKPMISYAINAALASAIFDHVVVTSDDNEIMDLATRYGAEVFFRRPRRLSDDITPTVPVIAHAIQECSIFYGSNIDYICCIYPTNPFLLASDLITSLTQFQLADVDYCFPVTEFPSSVHRALTQDEDGVVLPMFPENQLKRTQDLPSAYYDAGQFYWGRKSSWLQNPFLHSSSLGYAIPSWRVVDIDSPDDWSRAEVIYSSFLSNL